MLDRFDLSHLVWVIPVFSTFSICLSTSSTGSTGALHEMKITNERVSQASEFIVPWWSMRGISFPAHHKVY